AGSELRKREANCESGKRIAKAGSELRKPFPVHIRLRSEANVESIKVTMSTFEEFGTSETLYIKDDDARGSAPSFRRLRRSPPRPSGSGSRRHPRASLRGA